MGRRAFSLLVWCVVALYSFGQSDATPEKLHGTEKVAYHFTTGMLKAIEQQTNIHITDSSAETFSYYVAQGTTKGIVTGLNDVQVKEHIDSLLGSISMISLKNLSKLRDTLVTMRDSVFNDYLISWSGRLRDTLLGKGLDLNVKNLLHTVLGEESTALSRKFVRSNIDEVLSRATQVELTQMVDTLGIAFNRQAKALVDTVTGHILYQLHVGGALNDDADTLLALVKKHVIAFSLSIGLMLLAILATALIIWWLYRHKTRHEDVVVNKDQLEELIAVLTYEIHNIKDKDAYDDLTARIKDHALKDSLEPLLRELLKKQGIN